MAAQPAASLAPPPSTGPPATSPATDPTAGSTASPTGGPATLSPTTPAPTSIPATQAPTTQTPATGAPTGEPDPTPSTRPAVLRPGDHGPEVLALQQRLVELGYWLGTPDGTFGLLTQQAVLAAQKAAGIGLDGLAGPATRAALEQGIRPGASTQSGRVLEVDLARQLLLVVQDGRVEQIFNTSTGTDEWYEVDGRQYLADTPRGTWHIYRQVNGMDTGPLGDLYRPKYFHTDGIAIHGYSSVPARAASHGCVRVTNAAMDWLWSSGVAPIGTTVLVR